ncbi:hypothetical protein [Pseudonocardia sp. N23]|uniref:hypothetical protein n=1 Tax=Pseudonocardia sp. N23 TaxID=1987376 RepID=UPI000C030642|nr:hypothetical protein [Pseudonocardia sp. N23]GAY08719.1 transcriptional regulator, tetr family [Pseudonocardia sp. N23]
MYRAHLWAATLPRTGPPVDPHNLAWFDAALGALADNGLDPAAFGARYGAVLARVVDPRAVPRSPPSSSPEPST